MEMAGNSAKSLLLYLSKIFMDACLTIVSSGHEARLVSADGWRDRADR